MFFDKWKSKSLFIYSILNICSYGLGGIVIFSFAAMLTGFDIISKYIETIIIIITPGLCNVDFNNMSNIHSARNIANIMNNYGALVINIMKIIIYGILIISIFLDLKKCMLRNKTT